MRGRSRRATALLGIMLFLVAAPGWAQSREERQLNADLRMLQSQTQRLELLLNALGTAVETLSDKLDEQANVERKTSADLRLQANGISNDVSVVREKVDETNVRLGSMGQEVQALQISLQSVQTAVQALQALHVTPPGEDEATTAPDGLGLAGPALPPAAGLSTPIPAETVEVPPGVYPNQTFDQAHGDYMAGQYPLAVKGFEAYLSWFPTLPQAAEAQYYIGEAFRLDSQPEEALVAYDKVITRYPDSTSIPAARFKRGMVLEVLDQLDQARAEYETVVTSHPNSDEARLAQQRLDRLLGPSTP